MTDIHQHPLSIAQGIGRNLILLIFPLLRGLLALKFDIFTWIAGAWIDILLLLTVLSYAVLRYRSKYISFCENCIHIKSGVFLARKCTLPTEKITTIYFSQNLMHRLFGAVQLIIETNAGTSKKSDFSMLISKKNADIFESNVINSVQSVIKKCYMPKMHFIVMYSVQSTSTLSGILLLSAFFSQGGAILNRRLQNEFLNTVDNISHRIVIGIPPILVAVSVVLLVGWFIGFIYNLIRYLRFNITRKANIINISKGIFIKQKYFIFADNIISVERRQSMLTKFLGISSAFIYASGYGKGKGESAVIFPAVTNGESDKTIKMILPEFKFLKIENRPPKSSWKSYILLPLLFCLIIIISILFLQGYNSSIIDILKFSLIIALIPCVWLIIVRLLAWKLSGFSISGDNITISYVKGFSFRKISCKKDKIIKAKIIQNPLNRISGKCKLKIYCAGEKASSHTIIGLTVKQSEYAIKKIIKQK